MLENNNTYNRLLNFYYFFFRFLSLFSRSLSDSRQFHFILILNCAGSMLSRSDTDIQNDTLSCSYCFDT